MFKKLWFLMEGESESTSSGGSVAPSTSDTTPSATPPADTTAASEEPAVQGDDWDALALPDDDGDDGEGPVTETPAAETPAAPAAETPPAAAPGATGEEPKPAETTPAATPPTETPKAAATETPAPTKSQQELEAEARAAAERVEAELTEYYKLPEEDAEALRTEPEVALPKLAAKLHQAVLNNAIMQVNAMLPRAMAEFQQIQQAETNAKSAFYERWPGLKDYEPQVLAAGQMFRKMNPNATQEEALESVGAMVYAAMRQTPPAAAGAPAPAAGAPAAAPAQGTTPTAPAAKATFRPAAPGGGTPAGAPPKGGNEFEQLAEEFLREDQG